MVISWSGIPGSIEITEDALRTPVCHNSLDTEGCRWGLGRHHYYLHDEEKRQAMNILFLCEGWGAVSPTVGRITFYLFLLNFAISRPNIWSLRIMIGVRALIKSVMIVVIYTQCGSQLSAFWDPKIKADFWSPPITRDYPYFQCSKSTPRLI